MDVRVRTSQWYVARLGAGVYPSSQWPGRLRSWLRFGDREHSPGGARAFQAVRYLVWPDPESCGDLVRRDPGDALGQQRIRERAGRYRGLSHGEMIVSNTGVLPGLRTRVQWLRITEHQPWAQRCRAAPRRTRRGAQLTPRTGRGPTVPSPTGSSVAGVADGDAGVGTWRVQGRRLGWWSGWCPQPLRWPAWRSCSHSGRVAWWP